MFGLDFLQLVGDALKVGLVTLGSRENSPELSLGALVLIFGALER
jgi:hypothetical protein